MRLFMLKTTEPSMSIIVQAGSKSEALSSVQREYDENFYRLDHRFRDHWTFTEEDLVEMESDKQVILSICDEF